MKRYLILLSILYFITLADLTGQTTTTAFPGAITVTILPTQVVAGNATLTRNAPGVLIDNTPISLGSNALVVGTKTVPFPTSAPAAPIYTVAGDLIVTAGPAGVAVAGSTISNNGPAVTIPGEAATLSLGSSGLVIYNANGASTLSIPTVQPLQSVFALSGGQQLTEQYGRIVFPSASYNNLSVATSTGGPKVSATSSSSTKPFLGAAVVGKGREARWEVGALWGIYVVLVVLSR